MCGEIDYGGARLKTETPSGGCRMEERGDGL